MAFERPTLAELVDRIEQDLISRIGLAGSVLRRSFVRVLARVIAGAAHMLHGHLEFLSRQLFPDLSEDEFLERQGSLFGINKTSPEYAEGNVIVTGTNATAIPSGTVLLRADLTEYETDALGTIATLTAWANTTAYTVGQLRRNGGIIYQCITAGTSAGSGGPTGSDDDITDGTVHWSHVATGTAAVIIAVSASVAAEDGNCDADTFFTFESPISGADATVTVATLGLTGGADEEDEEDYRVRVMDRMRSPPHGGTEDDYIAWSKEVSGVTRVWVYPGELGAGTVVIRFARDEDDSPIPDSGEVTDVQDYVDALKPVTADVTVEAPTGIASDITLSITPDTAALRASVEAEYLDFLIRFGEPGGTLYLSAIRTAIGSVAGITDYNLTVPAADVVYATGELAIPGTITWV